MRDSSAHPCIDQQDKGVGVGVGEGRRIGLLRE